MNAKMMIAGMALLGGLAAVPAHADSLRIGCRDRHFGIGVNLGCDRPVAVAPAYIEPAPVVVEEPVIVDGGYYAWERGRRVFHRGRPEHFRRR